MAAAEPGDDRYLLALVVAAREEIADGDGTAADARLAIVEAELVERVAPQVQVDA